MYEVTCCPAFGVTLSTSSLHVYGSALTEQWVSQELTAPVTTTNLPYVNIDMPYAAESPLHVLWALREALSHLRTWYNTIVLAEAHPHFHHRLHPATISVKTSSGVAVSFDYLRRIEPHNHLFIAFGNSDVDKRTFVVKFTRHYGAEAHRLLADVNCAPDLVYCGSPYAEQFQGYTRMLMVVMEYCPNGHFMWDLASQAMRTKLRQAVALLHNNGMVHGDLRWQNVLVYRAEHLRLIDFDWAGPEGTARYPDDLSPNVPWPASAQAGELITKDHDLYWVERLFKSDDYLGI